MKKYSKEEALQRKRAGDRIYQKNKRIKNKGYKTSEYMEYCKKNPEKVKAHQALNRAKRRGEIKQSCCKICGGSNVHAHHDDYSKPLKIIWLCPVHHKQEHLKKI